MKEYREDMNVDQIREEVNTKNVLAAIDYTKDTRVLIAELTIRMAQQSNEVATLRDLVTNLTTQVGILRGEHYGGGPTS